MLRLVRFKPRVLHHKSLLKLQGLCVGESIDVFVRVLLVFDNVTDCVSSELLIVHLHYILYRCCCTDLLVASYISLLVKTFGDIFPISCTVAVASKLIIKYIGELSGANEDFGL